MKSRGYSVFDTKAGAFNYPFFVRNDELAIRLFIDALTNPDSNISKHPEDYSLHLLTEFDSDTGVLTESHPKCVLTGAEGLARVLYNKVDVVETSEEETQNA